MEVITSLENNKIKKYSKLLQKKYRDQENLFIIEGEHLIEEALKNNYLIEILTTEDYPNSYDIPTTYVTYNIIKKLSNLTNPPKIIGICKKKNDTDIGSKILIIDNLQDPGNLGTIIRSSVAFNIDTIVLSNNTVDLYNDKVIRSTEGMLFQINIIKKDLLNFIDELHTKGYQIYSTKVDNGKSLKDFNPSSKYAFIIGNEGNGIRKEILDKCDEHIYIPMNKDCESLNAAIATSIILYELSNK